MEKKVSVRSYVKNDLNHCLSLWNTCCNDTDFLYKPLFEKDFIKLFTDSEGDYKSFLFVAEKDSDFAGFIGGVTNEKTQKAYLTAVVVSQKHRRRGIGHVMVQEGETYIKENTSIKQVELIFFNPSALSWVIPGTHGHDHPNAPGVDVASGAYIFFKNMGYRDTVYQNSFYLPLDKYLIPVAQETSRERLVSEGISVEVYDPEKHSGFPELFDDLASEDWKNQVMSNIGKPNGGDPVLVVIQKGKIYGFAGPVRPEESGRGYFAGIGVHKLMRGKGAGKYLFSSLCLKEKEEGARFMTFFTGENNPARNIYEAAGFKIVRTWADMKKILVKD